jgi:hypothetical protein
MEAAVGVGNEISDRFKSMAAELVAANVDVLVSVGLQQHRM